MADPVCPSPSAPPPPSASCTDDYEFGGIFAVPAGAGTYTWTAYKRYDTGAWAAPKMKIVAVPVADGAEATLTAAKAKAVDGMGHTPCAQVEPGETIVPGEHKCSEVHIEGAGASVSYTLSLTGLTGHVAIFTEHDPAEFEVPGGHYLTSKNGAADAVDVEPLFSVGKPCGASPGSAHDHSSHGSAAAAGCTVAYEFGGIFVTPASAGTYTWTAYKKDGAWAAPKMKIVALPVADATQATLDAQKAAAVDGMGHTPCTQVEPGETIVPGDHKCSEVHIEGAGASVSFTLSSAELTGGHVAIFTEHSPAEFEVPGGHYLTSQVGVAAAVDVEPAFSVGKPAAVCPSPSAPPSPPAAPPPAKSDDNPCFSETATACRLDDAALLPAAAFAQCFGEADGSAAARVPMRALKAGDVVLSSPTEVTRVIVNQHAAVRLTSAVRVLEHETGSLALTPDHVLWADNAFRAAAEVREGAVLAPASKVTKVATANHAVVNPLTTSGTILAAGPTGGPVVASVFPEWIAHLLHGASLPYPLPLSGAAAAAYLFPASVQAYYDAMLEPFFTSTASGLKDLKSVVPAPVALTILLGFDVALVAGFALWSLTLKGAVALLAVGLVAKARRAKA